MSSPARWGEAAQGWTGHPSHSCEFELSLYRTPAPDVVARCLVTRYASQNAAFGPMDCSCRKGAGRGSSAHRTRDLLDPPDCTGSQRHIPAVTVVDPYHPLHGRTFRVAVQHRTLREPLSFQVEHRDGIILRIAATATDYSYCPSPTPRTRITPVAIRQLLGLLSEWSDLCELRPGPSGGGSPKRSADQSAGKS